MTPSPSPDDLSGLIERLWAQAKSSSEIQRQTAAAKSLRNSNGERDDCYMWPARDDTLEGRAAAALEALSTRNDELVRALTEVAEGGGVEVVGPGELRFLHWEPRSIARAALARSGDVGGDGVGGE